MLPRDQSRRWRTGRRVLRRLRFCALLLVLAVLGVLIYLHQAGLPRFVSNAVLARLQQRGLTLQFSRLQWRWDGAVVADNVRFGNVAGSTGPKLAFKEVEVRPNYAALARLRFQVKSLELRQGRYSWRVPGTNQPPHELSLGAIEVGVHLLPNDRCRVDHFQARFDGADIAANGTLANASAFQNWLLSQPKPPGTEKRAARSWPRMANALAQCRFSSPTRLDLHVRGDARKPGSFSVQGRLNATGARTSWGTARHCEATIQFVPGSGNQSPRIEVQLQAGRAQTRWADMTNLSLTLHARVPDRSTQPIHASLQMVAGKIGTQLGRGANARLSARWVCSITNAWRSSGQGEVRLDQVETRRCRVQHLNLAADFWPSPRNGAPRRAEAWWTNLAPYALNWQCQAKGLQSPKLKVAELRAAGLWRAPELEATQLVARLYGGQAKLEARLNVASRRLHFGGSSDFDVMRLAPLLNPWTRHWLADYSWKHPPKLAAEGSLTLPAWTDTQPDWDAEVKPTVRLHGHFHVRDGAFRGVAATAADAHFTYSNEVWRVPDLVVTRPEGRLKLAHESNERTRQFYYRVHSTIDIRALRPLLNPEQRHALSLLTLSRPPVLDGEVWGRYEDDPRIGIKGRVAITNFAFRGQSADSFQTALEYTNRVLKLLFPHLERNRGSQQLSAAAISADFATGEVCLTNAFSTADPVAVAAAIGRGLPNAIKPYHFLRPPTVRAHGNISLRDKRDADLHFTVAGGPLAWWKFRLPHFACRVDWKGEHVKVSDVQAQFYRGTAMGDAMFDFRPQQGTDFRFNAEVTNADLHALMADLSTQTNQLEGRLSARLNVVRANAGDPRSWRGTGRVELRDGLIWEIPLFGILSPVLDGLVPGLGNSRAREGFASFAITNGVIRSHDLEIKASGMRLKYWGALGLNGKLNAHAEAELLRDTWVVGRVLSVALWPVSKIFEYRITGTVRQPKIEPVYLVPKIIQIPLHPIRSMKALAPKKAGASTNAPPTVLPGFPSDESD